MKMEREIDRVLLNITKASGGIVAAALFTSAASLKLLVFLMRIAKKGLIASSMPEKFKDFAQKSSGDYTIYNIPLTEKNAVKMNQLNQMYMKLDKEKNPVKSMLLKTDIKELENSIPELNQLKILGINYCTLPKLNGSMQTIQVGIAKEQDQKFKNWFLNHLTSGLNGGEKNTESIKVFTEGNYTILNVPFEDAEELGIMFSDFNQMGINYAKCPDLNVGDGYTQIAIPNSDRGLVDDWFKLWKNRQMAEGTDTTKDIYVMDEKSYVSTAEVTTDDYINHSEQIYKDANAEFEKEAVNVPWEKIENREKSPEFQKLMENEDYVMITINKEKLVEPLLQENNLILQSAERNGLFISRIPGTYGKNKQLLVIPKKQVFCSDDGKTYVAFLNRKKQYIVYGADQKIIKIDSEDIYKSYNKVTRGFKKVDEISRNKVRKDPAIQKKTVDLNKNSLISHTSKELKL